jgi:acyl-CoA thioester hydrolase
LQGFLQRFAAIPHEARDDRKVEGRKPLGSPTVGRRHTHRIRVRYGECDPQGVVFNAHYFAYFDVALTELWRVAAGGYEPMMEGGVDVQVVEATARYKAPARFDEEIDISIEVTHLGTTSMVTALQIHRDGQLLVEGELVHVFVDVKTLTKTPIPDRFREAFA